MSGRPSPRRQNLTYAGFAGLAGIATVAFVVAALLVGLWLDQTVLGRRGPFTIGLLCLSVPISLGTMLWIALSMIKRIQLPQHGSPRADDAVSEEE